MGDKQLEILTRTRLEKEMLLGSTDDEAELMKKKKKKAKKKKKERRSSSSGSGRGRPASPASPASPAKKKRDPERSSLRSARDLCAGPSDTPRSSSSSLPPLHRYEIHDRSRSDRFEPSRYRHGSTRRDRSRSDGRSHRSGSKHEEYESKYYERSESRYERPESRYERPESRYERPESRYERPESRYERPESRYERPESRYERPESKYERPESRYERPESRSERPESRYERPESRYERPESRYERPESRYERPESRSERPESRYERPESRYERPESRYERPESRYERPESRYERPGSRYERPQSRRGQFESRRDWPNSRQHRSQTKNGPSRSRDARYGDPDESGRARVKRERLDLAEEEGVRCEAAREVLRDLEEPAARLLADGGATDEDRKRVLIRMFEAVRERMSGLRAPWAGALVLQYRVVRARDLDEAELAALTAEVVAARKAQETVTEEGETGVDEELDQILQDLDLTLFDRDIKPKIEALEDSDEDTSPVPAPPGARVFRMRDRSCGLRVRVTVPALRTNKFFLAIKKLLQKMKRRMRAHCDHIELELFQYVMRLRLEETLAALLQDVPTRLKAKAVVQLYREKHPEEKDDEVLLEALCAVWRGEYNDSGNENNVKKEIDADMPTAETVTIKQEKLDDAEMPHVVIKQERPSPEPDALRRGLLNQDVIPSTFNDEIISNIVQVKQEK